MSKLYSEKNYQSQIYPGKFLPIVKNLAENKYGKNNLNIDKQHFLQINISKK